MMSKRSFFREEDVFKENFLLGLLLLIVGLLLLIIYGFYDNFWLKFVGFGLVAIAGVILFMIVLISYSNEFRSEIFLFIWNELLYLLVGIPLATICILILPVSIYILMFEGDPIQIWKFSSILVLSLMISSLIYTSIKLWLDNRSSGLSVPEKVDKGPIEQLLYQNPSFED